MLLLGSQLCPMFLDEMFPLMEYECFKDSIAHYLRAILKKIYRHGTAPGPPPPHGCPHNIEGLREECWLQGAFENQRRAMSRGHTIQSLIRGLLKHSEITSSLDAGIGGTLRHLQQPALQSLKSFQGCGYLHFSSKVVLDATPAL